MIGGLVGVWATLALVLVAAAPASAHEPPARVTLPGVDLADGTGVDLADAVGGAEVANLVAALGDSVEIAEDGLYEVTLDDGTRLSTHGPDPRVVVAGRPGGLRTGPRRPPVCAGDRQTRFAIATPSRRARIAPVVRSVRASVERANAVIAASSRSSGGPDADLKVDCDRAGRVKVKRLRTRAHSFADVVSAARNAGLDSTAANYVIFARARAGDGCGTSSFRSDRRLAEENANRDGGAYAVIYGNCRGSAEVVLHEIAHMQGAVQYSAPYSTGSGRHCWDELDVLCYAPDGGDLHQSGVLSRCLAISFDCGHDTYFDAATEPGEYLADHWNLGSPLNRFLNFSLG